MRKKGTQPSRGVDASPRSKGAFAQNCTRQGGRFDRDRLPDPIDYFLHEDLKLIGRGGWKSARCPFHDDSKPSLRVRLATGGFRCMVCGAHGGDVLAFHMLRYGLSFIEAARALGAWEEA